jgi:hypothetical protein
VNRTWLYILGGCGLLLLWQFARRGAGTAGNNYASTRGGLSGGAATLDALLSDGLAGVQRVLGTVGGTPATPSTATNIYTGGTIDTGTISVGGPTVPTTPTTPTTPYVPDPADLGGIPR